MEPMSKQPVLNAGLLSSDILEQQFGPTEIEVLSQDGDKRVICTRVAHSRQVLEISTVKFIAEGAKKFVQTHQAVLDGMSMGKAFRRDKIDFIRQIQKIYRQELSANLEQQFGETGEATVVSVLILVGPGKTPYAEILETYSPAVDWPQTV